MNKLKDSVLFFNTFLLVGILILLVSNFQKNQQVISSPKQTASPGSPQDTAIQSTDKVTNGYKEYVNTFQKVKMTYPEDWTKKEYDGTVFVEFKKGDLWDFNIVRESMTSNPTLDEYKEKALNLVKTYKSYKLVESKEARLAKLPSFELVFNATFNKDFKIMQKYTIKQNQGYVLTYRSQPDKFDEQLKSAEKMMESFEILDN